MSKEEIKLLFEKKIKPRIAGLELDRAKTVRKIWLYCGSTAAVCGLIAFNFFQDNLDTATVFTVVLVATLYTIIVAGFVRRFKKEVIKEVFNGLIPGCSYDPGSCVRHQTFQQSRLVNRTYDDYRGEDLVRGKLGDMSIEFSEVEAIVIHRGSKGRKTEEIIYQGIFFAFTLPVNLRQDTLILADQAEKLLGRNIGRFFQKNSARTGYELVQVESVEFEKHYVVYSNDQIKSRVLLKPMVLNNLAMFKRKNKQVIDISIRDNMLYLCIKTNKNHFEPKIFGELVSFKDIREIYDLMMLVRDLQEDLELDVAS